MNNNTINLDELILTYGKNHTELKSLEKVCNNDSIIIKNLMLNNDLTERCAGDYTVKIIVSTRESFDENRLLNVMKEICDKNSISGIIKTKEYVDMNSLEDAIYKGLLSQNDLIELDNCKKVTEITSLRLNKAKTKKKDTKGV